MSQHSIPTDPGSPTLPCYYCAASVTSEAERCPTCGQPLLLRGRYQLLQVLAQGGFGVVYEALDREQPRRCAVKAVASVSLADQRLVEAEALLLSRHAAHWPFIPAIYDTWHEQAQTYLVMEYIEGQRLDMLIERPWPEPHVANFLRTLLGYLIQLHAAGVIHRDLKPENIIYANQRRFVLIDFGIAKQGTRTMTVARALSPDYAPPEQFQGLPTDARSDLYSLGATTYHLLTGQPPVRADARLVTGAPLVPPSQSRSEVPAALETTLLHMLELDPAQRPASAQAALALLTDGASGRSSAGQPTMLIEQIVSPRLVPDRADRAVRPPVPAPDRSGNGWFGWWLGLVVVALILGAFASGMFLRQAEPVGPVAASTNLPATVMPAAMPVAQMTAISLNPAPQQPPQAIFIPPAELEYIPIELPKDMVGDIRNMLPGFPIGDQVFGGVRFVIPELNDIGTQCVKYPGSPSAISVPVSGVSRLDRLSILINSEFSWNFAKDKEIGIIELTFSDQRVLFYPLVLGQNIRERRSGGPVGISVITFTSPYLNEIYLGPNLVGDYDAIDMLTLTMPQEYRNVALDSITFKDTSEQTVNSLDPCFLVAGITAQVRRQDSVHYWGKAGG